MKNFGLYLLMLFSCSIGALIITAMIRSSLWYSFALLFPAPTWWVSYSLFKIMVSEKTRYKTCFVLIGCLAFIILWMILGTLFIGTESFFGLTFALFLFISAVSTIRLIYMISNKKAKQELIAEESQEPEEK